jgi:hypothetical protein
MRIRSPSRPQQASCKRLLIHSRDFSLRLRVHRPRMNISSPARSLPNTAANSPSPRPALGWVICSVEHPIHPRHRRQRHPIHRAFLQRLQGTRDRLPRRRSRKKVFSTEYLVSLEAAISLRIIPSPSRRPLRPGIQAPSNSSPMPESGAVARQARRATFILL